MHILNLKNWVKIENIKKSVTVGNEIRGKLGARHQASKSGAQAISKRAERISADGIVSHQRGGESIELRRIVSASAAVAMGVRRGRFRRQGASVVHVWRKSSQIAMLL